jgi:hypothetical protein
MKLFKDVKETNEGTTKIKEMIEVALGSVFTIEGDPTETVYIMTDSGAVNLKTFEDYDFEETDEIINSRNYVIDKDATKVLKYILSFSYDWI